MDCPSRIAAAIPFAKGEFKPFVVHAAATVLSNRARSAKANLVVASRITRLRWIPHPGAPRIRARTMVCAHDLCDEKSRRGRTVRRQDWLNPERHDGRRSAEPAPPEVLERGRRHRVDRAGLEGSSRQTSPRRVRAVAAGQLRQMGGSPYRHGMIRGSVFADPHERSRLRQTAQSAVIMQHRDLRVRNHCDDRTVI